MAGLVCAARARELGADVEVHEKGTRLGGSMLLSSCVVWRHLEWDDFREECPAGDERLQRLVWERLDDALAWLNSLGAPVVWQDTENPRTTGRRYDPRGLVDVLAARAGGARLRSQVTSCHKEPTVLATGGFAAAPELVADHIAPAAPLRLRGNRWSTGDGLRIGGDAGGALSAGMDEFYGRNMPDREFGEDELVAASQLYGRYARVFDERGREFFEREVSWSENDLVQATARQPGARAWYVLDAAGLERARAMVERARTAVAPSELPFETPRGAVVAVRVAAAITHTIGGLRVDDRARVLRGDGSPVDGLYAAGVDAGGVATGGYASGLAQALVLGLVAAESAAA